MDRFRKKPFLIFGLVIFFFAPILYLFCKTPLQLALARIFHALGVVSFTPAGLSLSSETTTKRKGEALGWYGTAVMMGAALGPAIGGYLLSSFDYEIVFIVSAISPLVVILPSYALIQEEKYQKITIEERKIEKQPKIGQVIFNKMMLGACVALFTLTVVYGVLLSIFPVSARNKGFTPVQIGMFFSIYALTAVILRVIVGKISDRIGRIAVIIPGMIISIIASFLILNTNDYLTLLLAAVLYGAGFGTLFPVLSSIVADVFVDRPQSLGLGLAILTSFFDLGFSFGSIVFGFITDIYGDAIGFNIAVLIPIVGIVSLYTLSKLAKT